MKSYITGFYWFSHTLVSIFSFTKPKILFRYWCFRNSKPGGNQSAKSQI